MNDPAAFRQLPEPLVPWVVGHRSLAVVGKSMWPLLPSGVEVEVRPLAAPPALGAIVVFAAADRIVIHRLMRVLRESDRVRYVTKGDASLEEDPPIEATSVLGEVAVVRYRWFSLRLNTPARRWSGWFLSRAASVVRRGEDG